jgi:hypothetical protein
MKGHGSGRDNSQFNTIWINKDNLNRKIMKEEFDLYLSQGWSKGRFLTEERLEEIVKVNESRRKVERPPYEQLIEEIESLTYKGTAIKYGVSPTAIKKWRVYYEKQD